MEDKTLIKSVNDYANSLEKVLGKRKQWKEFAFPLLIKTLHDIRKKHEIGWQVQELNWLMNNKAVNISFETFPKSLIDKWPESIDFEFIKGAALVFSQKYNGNVAVFIIYPEVAVIRWYSYIQFKRMMVPRPIQLLDWITRVQLRLPFQYPV